MRLFEVYWLITISIASLRIKLSEKFEITFRNYFTISTFPPDASIEVLALSLIAFILKFNVAFNSPVANIFTLSVRLIKPFIYKFSSENSVKAYFFRKSGSDIFLPRLDPNGSNNGIAFF